MQIPPDLDDDGFVPINDAATLALAQQAVQAANDAPEEPLEGAPSLPVPNRDALHVKLAVGSYNPLTGKEYREAEVRELTGEDEEYFSRGKSFHDRKMRLIERGTLTIGGEPADEAIFAAISAGDHEVLLLAIRRATYGDTLEFDLTCPRCGEEQESLVDLSKDVPIRAYDRGQSEITLPSGKHVVFHWPTGEDDRLLWEFAEENKQASIAELNTQMISRVVESIDGDPSFGVQTARAMNMRDRRELVTHIAENLPGPQYSELQHRCANEQCGHIADLEVSFEDLFR